MSEATEQTSLENQIQAKETQLEQLKILVKEKLESGFSVIPLVGEVRNEKWQSRLEKLLDRQAKIIRGEDSEKLTKIKNQLREKLTEEEIKEICKTQKELTKLQLEQEQQLQAKIQFEGNN